MKGRRFFTALGIFLVTVVAGAISYRHQSELALHNGQPAALAAIWPACVDGLVMSCGIAIATDRAGGFRPRPWALLGFWVGVVVSVLTNWLATSGGPIAHAVSAFPAIAFLIAVESLSSKPRAMRVPKVVPVEVSPVVENAASPVPVETSVEAPAPGRKAPVARPRKSAVTATKVAKVAAKKPTASVTEIAVAAGVSERTAHRYMPPAVVPTSGPPVNGHSFAEASV